MNEQTPLHLAARHGRVDIVAALLEAGCAPNPMDIQGLTPELLAMENDQHAVVKIISEHLDKLEAKLETAEGEPSGLTLPAAGTKTWKLPLLKSQHVMDVMKDGNMTIYAVHGSDASEEVKRVLGDNDGNGVFCLGKPYKRRI